jgi:RNA polymerase sigma factor (sigma-70 family)
MAVMISARLLEGSDRLLDAEPDAQLVRLAQAGHVAAFAAIVRRYERELKAQAHRLTSDGRAEDALQQAFLNAFAALQAGHEVRHLRGWLHHILRNEVIRARVPLEAPLDPAAAYGEPLEDTVQLRATAHAALTELSALPERQRDALLSTAVLGLPRAHVARAMGLSEGAVRQLVHRARTHLRHAANALLPLPLVKLFGAAPSGMDAAPDVALSASAAASGAAASGGLAIKVGALLASGVVATGVAATHISPVHRPTASSRDAQHRVAGAPATRVSPSSARGAAASVSRGVRRDHGSAASEVGSHGGPGRLIGTRFGRHGGPGSGRGHGEDGGGGDGGSGRPQDHTSGQEHHGSGPDAPSGTGSGSPSGSVTGSAGSGPDNGGATRDGGGGSEGSGGGGSSGSGSSGSGGSGSGSSDGGRSDGGSGGGGKESSGGSRDLSGSPDSSSS